MGSEIIKQFMVGLGFSIDDASLAKFNKSLAMAALKVSALYATIQLNTGLVFKAVSHIADSFEEFGYSARLIAPAINKTLMLRQAMLSAYGRAGIDIQKAVQQSVIFNFSLAKTKFALDAIYKSVGAKFLPALTRQMDVFRSKIYANMPKIQSTLERMIKFLLKAFDATVHLGGTVFSILGRIWDFFAKLDEATNGWSTKILLAVAAWKLLNLSFLASPLGLVLTGILAILALYDDFKTFTEGGQSLFDWGPYIPIINKVTVVLSSMFDVVKNLINAFGKLLEGDFEGFFIGMAKYGDSLIETFKKIGFIIDEVIISISRASGLSKIIDKVSGFFGGGSDQGGGSVPNANPMGGALASILQPAPMVGKSGGNTQHVNQETNINVQGSADAHATGKAVSGEQSKVNFDLTRNLRGAAR